MKKILYSFLYLLMPSIIVYFLFSGINDIINNYLILIGIAHILSLTFIIPFFIYKPCGFKFLLSGLFISSLSGVLFGIIGNIQSGLPPLTEIEYAPIFVGGWFFFYSLPIAIISTFLERRKSKRIQVVKRGF